MAALYRKYRPQTFADVVGQEAVVRTLTNAIEQDKVRQAYLFAGPRGTGKTSLARILAKGINCAHGPTATPDDTCHSCVAISNGTSLDVVEMDAASQRGIDDIREIRERVVLQPVEGRSKVYILDEAHQLTDAAWNALLKLIEEPPPHLLFVFCTTELQKVLPTVRSRCQTFVFQRPRLPDLVRKLRRIADGEGIDVPDAALALVARGGRGAFRDAESTLDQLAAATSGTITVQDVLQLLGAVEEEVLFRLCDLVVDGDTAGALVFLEELSEQGQDLGRLVTDLLEHLRHLLLVQHMHEVPDSLPVTDETRERLREQANQLPAATVLRLIDLLHVAVEDMRQGGDPRLPLELALVKVTRPAADLSRESLAFRLERLEQGQPVAGEKPRAAAAGPTRVDEANAPASAEDDAPPPATMSPDPPRPGLSLDQLREAWRRSILPAVEQRSIPIGKTLAEGHPTGLAEDTLTVEFPAQAAFHMRLAEDPKNAALLVDALHEVTGRKLAVAFTLGEARGGGPAEDDAASEADVLELMKSTFDARELEGE
ncbi:MAG TPA: DNA polymerase III subunit gamma/tau [Gaiellaceae bacterium]|nr:DNA polymerase III subunit gamma/tau [Gaiellaceae bacterium]